MNKNVHDARVSQDRFVAALRESRCSTHYMRAKRKQGVSPITTDPNRLPASNGVVFRHPRPPTAMPTIVCPEILNLEEVTWYRHSLSVHSRSIGYGRAH
jgi:hypothetical protein